MQLLGVRTKIARHHGLPVGLSMLAVVACACGSGKSTPAQPRVIGVSVSPAAVHLEPGGALKFTASVSGSPGVSQSVEWTIGNYDPERSGHLDADGTYHAPATTFGPVTILATSVADPSKQGRAVVDLPVYAFTLAPTEARILTGDTIQFSVSVTGVATQPILSWRATIGTIDASGLYTAPDFPTMDFVSVGRDAGSFDAGAHVVVSGRPPVLDSISGPAAPGDPVTVTGSFVGTSCLASFPSARGAPINVFASCSGNAATVIVPVGAQSGPLHIEKVGLPSQGVLVSNSLDFVRAPRILIHPLRNALARGDSVPISVTWLGAAGPLPVTWDVDVGGVENGVYAAPDTAIDGTVAHVRACVTGTANCSQSTLVIHALRVEPAPALVPAGGSFDLLAYENGASANAAFTITNGKGVLTANGHYAAPGVVEDTGPQWLSASVGGDSTGLLVGVTGLQPGLLNRIVDNVDWNQIDPATGAPPVASVQAVAISGTRLFVLRRQLTEALETTAYLDAHSYEWIEVYDLKDPVHPAWIDAVECPTHATDLFATAARLYAWSGWDDPGVSLVTAPLPSNSVIIFDVSAGSPQLLAGDYRTNHSGKLLKPILAGDRLFIVDEQDLYQGRTIPVRVYDSITNATSGPRILTIPFPDDAYPGALDGITTDGVQAFGAYGRLTGVGLQTVPAIAQWDITVDPAVVLASASDADPYRGEGRSSLAGPVLLRSVSMYDRTRSPPVHVGDLPFPMSAVATNGDLSLLAATSGGLYVLDTTAPSSPRLVTSVEPGFVVQASAAWNAGIAYSAQGNAGLGIYDTAVTGGAVPMRSLTMLGAAGSDAMNGAVVQNHFLYATGYGATSPTRLSNGFAAWDLSAPGSTAVWVHDDGSATGWALAAVGTNRLLRGAAGTLELWSTAIPVSPQRLGWVTTDVGSVVFDGSIAWVGTLEGDLVAFDVTSTATPIERGRLALGALPFGLALAGPGRIAVALASQDGGALTIIDSTAPSSPAVVGTGALSAQAYGVAIDGGIAAVATAGGLATVDLSDPVHPRPLARVALPFAYPYFNFDRQTQAIAASSVVINDGLAWVGSFAQGMLYQYDIRDPVLPRLVGHSLVGGPLSDAPLAGTNGLIIDGELIYAFGDLSGRGVLGLDITNPRNVLTLTQPESKLLKHF